MARWLYPALEVGLYEKYSLGTTSWRNGADAARGLGEIRSDTLIYAGGALSLWVLLKIYYNQCTRTWETLLNTRTVNSACP